MELTDRFSRALTYALDIHRQQKRKGSDVPYYSHLMAVTALVLEHGESEDEAIAALLHDSAEDLGGKPVLDEIEQLFGPHVACLVFECSDSLVAHKEERPPWKERKVAYIDQIKDKSKSARLISSADKLHNARTILRDYRLIGDELWARFRPDKDDILWYYQSLVQKFKVYQPSPIVDELARVVADIERMTA